MKGQEYLSSQVFVLAISMFAVWITFVYSAFFKFNKNLQKNSAELIYRKCSPRKFCRINLQLYVCNTRKVVHWQWLSADCQWLSRICQNHWQSLSVLIITVSGQNLQLDLRLFWQWLSVTVSDCQWLSVTVSDCQWLSVIVSDHACMFRQINIQCFCTKNDLTFFSIFLH